MGLDQYAFQRNKNTKLNGEYTEEDRDNIKYEWRKHARLQVFMRDLHRQKNPDAKMGTYNLGMNGLDIVELTSEDLTALQKAIETDYYEYFADDGFFWGQQWQEEMAKEYKDQDIKFVKWAKKEIENGDKVFYSCSW